MEHIVTKPINNRDNKKYNFAWTKSIEWLLDQISEIPQSLVVCIGQTFQETTVFVSIVKMQCMTGK